MKYRDFSYQDFVEDAYFRQWIYQPDEASNHFWKNWLTQHPEKQEDVEQARLILLSVQFKQYSVSAKEENEVWNQILQQRNAARQPSLDTHSAQIPRWKSSLTWGSAVAASVALLLLAYVWWARPEETVYTAEFGTTRTIILTDQSTVELNANSTLRVTSGWARNREVWLEGEAFFEIQPKETQAGQRMPFLVHTNELIVEVLGTEFNVLTRRGETQVGLQSGKVKLALNTQDSSNVEMQPGDWIAFSENNEQLKKETVASDAYTAWRNHGFLFDEHTLSKVKTMLEDYYGYSIHFDDAELAQRTFSGKFPADRLDLLLQAIQATLDVKIKRTDDEILISEK
uniref:FecR domain-containing protein n=1 Tax=Roseihalotalea indica TaxID=2867963 RepID=A0AA49GKV4_9BACT|nr:FecR domain-containing protein [Tunicatimonas sp. TK19036]